MNLHNELYFLYKEGSIGNADILSALDKGLIDRQSCNVIMAQSPNYTLEQLVAHKNKEFNYFCTKNIEAGVDVKLSDGTVKHFSLTTDDQLNMHRAFNQMLAGETAIEYHADGDSFRIYSPEDIAIIYSTCTVVINSQTVYRNNLREWAKQLTDIEEIRKITYGVEIPEKYWTDGWRSIQEKIKQEENSQKGTNQVAHVTAEIHNEEPAEEQSKETIVSKAINAVTGKSRKKKATSEETTS